MNYINYSKRWKEELKPCLNAKQNRDWDKILKYYGFNRPENVKAENLIVLSEGVWVKIKPMDEFRKIRGISKHNVYYDGDYPPIYHTSCLGGMNHKFIIDERAIDLQDVPEEDAQKRLLDFIKIVTGISDLPSVPKGILKL